MTDNKKKKISKKKWDFEIKPMDRKEADAEMKRFLSALEDYCKDVPEAELRRGANRVKDFVEGRISWADMFNYSPEMLFQMAEFGFTQFKSGRYGDAERVFKVLTVLDWKNAYYHSVMGSILQREQRYGEALAEYDEAISLDPADIVSLTNKGEILMQHDLKDEARICLQKASELDPDAKDRFANRARMLLAQMDRIKKEGKKR